MRSRTDLPDLPRRRFLISTGALLGLGALGGLTTPGRAIAGETPHWRPAVRFAPERNWINDPNGLVFFDGEYHLFCQHNPSGDQWGNMSWLHAVSTDLVRWQELPVALEPDELGAIFSGSAVVDHHDTSGFFGGKPGLVALYTSAGDSQQQSLAHSSDRGRTWTKYDGNPVIPNPGIADFRDPKVFWHEPTGRWVLLLAAGDRIQIYGSPNLRDWEQLSEFGAERGAHGGVWECPDLFELPVDGDPARTRWVMIVSINPGGPAGGSATQYFIGDFDGTTFTAEGPADEVRWADRGADFYAPQSFSDVPDGRRLWLGWTSNWDYAAAIPTSPWRGMMSTPRELGLTDAAGGVQLVQRPVAELSDVRANRRAWGGVLTDGSDVEFRGSAVDVVATFRLGTAPVVGVDVFAGPGGRTRVGYDVAAGELFVDRTDSGEAQVSQQFPARHGTPLAVDGGVLALRVVADRSCVEVFAQDGRAVLTDLVFPDSGSDRIAPFAAGGRAEAELEVFDLTP
ncbi:glycoside hydrolase family 32 protein [Saccharopolyspora mangrovi]|uniref:Glycoside hydrolase family 32 protein n=1 Tax=Saccharopolyspora mangrovi TaxID=3082379 RepID=A0ABU6A6T9_9PSEU|nr:glycoside hydrolase family 32 protein [Saccharopolyspora sp. S2-29]MEB3367172.1 glycoside hydrolase family 32 protein [Saccharopolyspora sp. S2-29]